MNEANNNPGGFSLVEVVVAILVLSFGLLAMAASTGYVATQLKSTTWDTQRNLARQQVIEQLKAAGLQGRGGAGFPAHIKWAAVRGQAEQTSPPASA